ncbi:hypothetical protein K08M3_18770 [Vibrio alginolyticus]|uniref:Uncharacterized protein n=1 Tax=Vibrio alginolyticus TaxID=663 RepID=A0A1W6V0S6_VIBAL|nr:hypothetical protein K04M1_18860 [Vibrio alginolyticus]ARP08590.1 hypothetical protein K04M3_18890 [Vibrio alginolyticus]ARP13665.1 hypothetical protein K04M5_18770 [Vibrio alginolyticus]ARP18725.1 hypothetical protein K05K4_18910 [Vibrio alginolyticus]ARP33613.1 hypothetical protein K08M3_18770 [Vibrio alginolyticus]
MAVLCPVFYCSTDITGDINYSLDSIKPFLSKIYYGVDECIFYKFYYKDNIARKLLKRKGR